MTFMEKLRAFFSRINSDPVIDVMEEEPEEKIEVKDPHHFMPLMFGLQSGDYSWTEPDSNSRKVFLTNPEKCEKLDAMALAAGWAGSGHCEWEYIWAIEFLRAVDSALEEGKSEADISLIFNRDYLASRDRKFPKEKVWEHCTARFFDIVEETDEAVRIAIRIATT